MKVIIADGTAKEIAALVVELQGRQLESYISPKSYHKRHKKGTHPWNKQN